MTSDAVTSHCPVMHDMDEDLSQDEILVSG
jgi:hypothetical protein